MLLPWLILIPFIGGFLCWQNRTLWRQGAALDRADHHGIDAGAVAATVVRADTTDAIRQNPQWQSEFNTSWIPRFGISAGYRH